MSASRAEKARSTARRIAEEKLVARLSARLELNFAQLCKLIQSNEQYPRENVEELVLKSLALSPARYRGYSINELKRVTKSVIALIESKAEKKPEVLRSDPSKQVVQTPRSSSKPARGQATNISNGPANPPRPLSKRQQRQADETPSPPPVADLAATRTTRSKGAPKKVSKDSPNYLTILVDALNELFERNPDLKDACEAGNIDHEDTDIRTAVDGLISSGKISAKSAGRLLKLALKDLGKQYSEGSTLERTMQPVRSKQSRVAKVQKPAVAKPDASTEPSLSPKMQQLFDKLPQPTTQFNPPSDDAHLSEIGKEKNSRALDRLLAMPVTKTG